MRLAIMGIDPGVTTGLVMMVVGDERDHAIECVTPLQVPTVRRINDPDRYTQYERTAIQIEEQIQLFRKTAISLHQIHPAYHIIVCEDFDLRTQSAEHHVLSPVIVSCMLIGIRTGLSLAYGPAPAPFVWSSPSIRSAIMDEGLKQAGLWIRGAQHSRSAIRHAVMVARRRGVRGLLAPRDSPVPGFFDRDM